MEKGMVSQDLSLHTLQQVRDGVNDLDIWEKFSEGLVLAMHQKPEVLNPDQHPLAMNICK